MARIPSTTILCKDIIGQAQEIVSEDEARRLIKSLGIIYYNNSLAELYNIMLLADINEYDTIGILPTTMYEKRWYVGNLAVTAFANMNDIKRIVCNTDSKYIECLLVDGDTFQSYRNENEADYPYNESIIYSLRGNEIDILFGKDIYVKTPTFTVTFRRNFTMLTDATYDTAYIDLPQNYFHLLSNRIASYAELRKGITDKSLGTVKFLYEQILSNIEPALKRKIIDSLQTEKV